MAVSEKTQIAIIKKALGQDFIGNLSHILPPEQLNDDTLIAAFGERSLHEQFRALQEADVTLKAIGYGIPSKATVAKFGDDGKMQSPRAIEINPGSTYES